MSYDARSGPFRPGLFEGRRVLITGGGTGLGRCFAESFVGLGADVLIASRDPDHLRPAADAIRRTSGRSCHWVACDVREPDQVKRLAEETRAKLGGLDVLVNNAAGNFLAPAESMSPNAWRSVIDIVLNGTFFVTRECFPLLRESRGSVVNVVANYAWGAAPFVAHSGAAKAGVLNLTRSLALEWARHGIRVNAVTPGVVPTEGAKGQLFPTPEMERAAVATIPLGRLEGPDEVAHAVLFLASPAAAYVTGENLVVDGGQWLAGNAFYQLGGALAKAAPAAVKGASRSSS